MEGGLRRATEYLFVLSLVYVSHISCQNALEGGSRGNQQSQMLDSRDPKAQLMDTLISIASGKKGFPDAPQLNAIQDKSASDQNQRQNTFNVMSISPQMTSVPKETVSVKPLTTNSLPQPVISNSMNAFMPASFTSYSPYMRPYQPVVMSASCCARPPQVIPLENYANILQSHPASWQITQPATVPSVLYAEPSVNPIIELNPSNPSAILPTVKTEAGVYDVTTGPCTIAAEPVVVMGDREGLPFNVQINVPPQTMAAPRITLVSAPPASVPSNPDPPIRPNAYPPPMPIIMRNQRSSWKNILPIILIALFSDRDSCGGCCPCNCGCNSDSPTPIPYPIPIPVNNPIINNGGPSTNRSHRRGSHQNEDYNDEN